MRRKQFTVAAIVALSLLLTAGCAVHSAEPGNASAQPGRPAVALDWAANEHLTALDDLSKLWTWFGLGRDGPMNLQAEAPIRYYTYDPHVVDMHTTEPVTLTVYTEETVTDMYMDLWAGGTISPTVIGPDTYQFEFTPAQALYDYDSRYYRNFVGYLYIDTTSGYYGRLNMFVNVLNDDVPAISPQFLAPDAQAGLHVANLLVPAASPGSYDYSVFHRFYGLYPDAFDFINVVWVDNRVQNRTHGAVSNHVEGIGRGLFDYTNGYGSAGRLQGINNFPVSMFFDGAASGFQHETGHQWINFVLPGKPHWPISEMAQGIMGYSIPGTGVGGHFPWRFTPNPDGTYTVHKYGEHLWEVGFCDLDLYLMGLLPADQVGPALVFENQDQPLCDGCVLEGPVYFADANTIIDSHGPRLPDASSAPHSFTVGTIVVTRDRLLTPEELAFFDFMADRASFTEVVHASEGFGAGLAKPWYLNTRMLSTLDTEMEPLTVTPTPTQTSTPTLTPTLTVTPTDTLTPTPTEPCTPGEEVLDQSQTGVGYGYWFEATTTRWQEFMPTLDNLTAVEVYIQRIGSPGNVIVEIKTVEGTLLRQAAVGQGSVGTGWLRIEFWPAIVLTPGTKYRIHVASDQGSPSPAHRYAWMGSTTSSYNPECKNDVSHLWPGFDYGFKTYGVCGETPTRTPTPTSTLTPTPPNGLSAPRLYTIVNDDGDGYYLVDWSAVDGASFYILEEDGNHSSWHPTEAYHGSSTLFWVDSKAPGAYFYRVKASDGVRESDWSNVQSVVVTQGAPSPTYTPTATPSPTPTPTTSVIPARFSVCLPIVMRGSQLSGPATSTKAPTATVAPTPIATPTSMAADGVKSRELQT